MSEEFYKEFVKKVVIVTIAITIFCLSLIFNYLISTEKKESERSNKEKEIDHTSVEP